MLAPDASMHPTAIRLVGCKGAHVTTFFSKVLTVDGSSNNHMITSRRRPEHLLILLLVTCRGSFSKRGRGGNRRGDRGGRGSRGALYRNSATPLHAVDWSNVEEEGEDGGGRQAEVVDIVHVLDSGAHVL